ncbi:MAG: hypothetical protein K0Q78_999 [Cellvibrio sp.]|jgi:hypothetical protein|nr:hypothetical protein [Cellvibrio sp.]
MAFFIGTKAVLFLLAPMADEAMHVTRNLVYKPNSAFISTIFISPTL